MSWAETSILTKHCYRVPPRPSLGPQDRASRHAWMIPFRIVVPHESLYCKKTGRRQRSVHARPSIPYRIPPYQFSTIEPQPSSTMVLDCVGQNTVTPKLKVSAP